ncbi:MAG: cytochrome c oxidase subunit II [Proteobacteria bacterium]|nr:cytochrome c oxidase subunit II [Pseudomonadota bacterium]
MTLGIIFWNSYALAKDVGKGYFDDAPLSLSPELSKSPMYTLVGITDWGKEILHVYGITTIIALIVFLCVSIPILYVLFRFRATGEEQELPKQVKGNYILEIIWTVIPLILLSLIAVPTWQSIFRQDKAVKANLQDKNALRIEVVGYQWWWKFVYTDFGVITANELILPENTPVVFSITSADVIHSFYIPRFGGKLDAIPGKVNKLTYVTPALKSNSGPEGDYYMGQCMELCGLSHALMRFQAVIRSQEAFQDFIKSHNQPPVVTTASEKRGEEVFNLCIACHTIAGTPSANLPSEKIGPDLSNFGDRKTLAAVTRKNNMANLKAWLKNPLRFKPGSLMPDLQLTDQQIDDVSAYIQFSTAKNKD